MRFIDIIEKKRDGLSLSKDEIDFWIDGYLKNEVKDYQVSALLMAIVLKGMNAEETAYLTKAMMYSGDVFDLSSIEGIIVDKHSTGGVGDKTSLVLGPLVASLGAKVAKMSGRGLGHTGGTLDKLESIAGYNINLDQEAFINQINSIGIAIIGQSGNLVPADKKLYALRDVTGTIPSIALIASSIMSKKLAAGAHSILLDVKYGDGAFMQTPDRAVELANAMIEIGQLMGKEVKAIISDMNEPLGNAIGNALEVKEAIDTLHYQGPNDLTDLCVEAGAMMLVQAKIFNSTNEAKKALIEKLKNGEAFAKFCELVKAQGGDLNMIINPSKLPKSKHVTPILATKNAFISHMHTMDLGILAMQLGAGRKTKDDTINPAVGIVLNQKIGSYVNVGDVLAFIH
ncbi:MAG: pyrimidine-nucleoside phosphorylase, partial [Erysipelotrichaceae bacterium]